MPYFRNRKRRSNSRWGKRAPKRQRTVRRRRRTGGMITEQRDVVNTYRRKRPNRAALKRWKSFTRKVNAVAHGDLGIQQVQRAETGSSTAALGAQGYLELALYPVKGPVKSATNSGLDDIEQMRNASGLTSIPMMFRSASMDVTLTNPDTANVLELDFYYFYPKKVSNNTVSIDTANERIELGFTSSAQLGSTSKLSLTTLGVTPFQSSEFCRYFTITETKRIYLQPGASTSFTRRDGRNREINCDLLAPLTSVSYFPGITQGLLIVFREGPDGTNASTASVLNWNCQRKYSYKAPGVIEDKTGVL